MFPQGEAVAKKGQKRKKKGNANRGVVYCVTAAARLYVAAGVPGFH